MDFIRHYIGWLPRLAAERFVRTMKIYPEHQHERLKKDMGIRIARLQPLSWDGLIHCTVEEVELSDDPQEKPRDPYDALSYAWWLDSDVGDPRQGKQRTIICNNMLLPVYENLYNALLQLQKDAAGVPLWIDAICIAQKRNKKRGFSQEGGEEEERRREHENKEIQEAEEERKHQIKMMGKIFSSARKVIVWLGRETLAMRFALWRTECFFTGDYSKLFEEVDSKNWFLSCLAMLDGSIRLLALRWIFCKGWFSRLWTLQETILAKDIIFVLGARSLDIFGFLDHGEPHIVQLIGQSISQVMGSNRGDYSSNVRGLYFARDTRQNILNDLEFPILEALVEARGRRCTRPQDKVRFILSSMASEIKESGEMEANSDKSVQEVYSECAAKFLKDPQCGIFVLSMVGQVRHDYTDHPLFPTSSTRTLLKGINLVQGLPSWVLDLTTHPRPYPLCNLSIAGFRAGYDEPPSVTFSDPIRFLHLKAAKLDVITKIGNCQERRSEAVVDNRWWAPAWLFNQYYSTQEDFTAIWEVALELGALYRHTDESVMSAFIKTLSGGETHFIYKKDDPEYEEKYRKLEIRPSDFIDWFISEVEKTILNLKVPPQYILHILGEEGCLTPHEQKVIAGEAKTKNCTIEQLRGKERHVNALSRFIARFDNDEYKIRERLKHLYEEIESGRVQDRISYKSFRKKPPFKSVLERHFRHRCHFCTKDGYIGSGPWTVEEGDVIMIVAGGYVPYIFRKPQIGPDAWELIGEAYCHGVMHGEAFGNGGLDFETITVH